MQRRPVVYLIASPSLSRHKKPVNLTPLYDHGEVRVVCPQGESPTFKPNLCCDVITERLAHFDPEVDFLTWAGGDALAAVMAGMVLVERGIWSFKWLRYERNRLPDGRRVDDGAKYEPILIDLTDPEETQ